MFLRVKRPRRGVAPEGVAVGAVDLSPAAAPAAPPPPPLPSGLALGLLLPKPSNPPIPLIGVTLTVAAFEASLCTDEKTFGAVRDRRCFGRVLPGVGAAEGVATTASCADLLIFTEGGCGGGGG